MPKVVIANNDSTRNGGGRNYDSTRNVTNSKVTKTGTNVQTMTFNKDYGQHILKNPMIVQQIVDKADIKPTDIVIEIGSGTGNLTARLLERAKKVIAFEIDPRMIAELRKRFQGTPYDKKLDIISGDVIKSTLPFFNVCVANVPYQISSPLVTKLLKHKPHFRIAVLMFQKEFSERLYAQPGDEMYSRLSVNTQLFAVVKHVMKVGKNNFKPPPKVESSVVSIEPKISPPVDMDELDGLLRICFVRKNKSIGAEFKSNSVIDMMKENYLVYKSLDNKGCKSEEKNINNETVQKMILDILESNNFTSMRPRQMDSDDFLRLLKCFNENGFHFS